LEENHKFIRDDDDDDDDDDDKNGTGEKEIARRYYEKLFREFALVELGRWREGMVCCG
jgi:protein FRA10AC1